MRTRFQLTKLLAVAVLLFGCTGLNHAFAQDRDDDPGLSASQSSAKRLTGVGIGWWYALDAKTTGDDATAHANGLALSWASPHFLVSGGFDGKKDGYILAGPGLPLEWAGRSGRFRIPLHALVGVTRFETGVIDYGGAVGLLWAGREKAGAGVVFQLTRHNAAVTLNIVF